MGGEVAMIDDDVVGNNAINTHSGHGNGQTTASDNNLTGSDLEAMVSGQGFKLNKSDFVFPIAFSSLYALGFTHAQAHHIQDLVVLDGFDPDSAVWIQKTINVKTANGHVTARQAKNLIRLQKAGWEIEKATKFLMRPKNAGWNKSGKDLLPPPPGTAEMMRGGWSQEDAVRYIICNRGRVPSEVPSPTGLDSLLKAGWSPEDGINCLVFVGGKLGDRIPPAPSVAGMERAGWAMQDAIKYLVDHSGKLGASIPLPPTQAEPCRKQKRSTSAESDVRSTLDPLRKLIKKETAEAILAFKQNAPNSPPSDLLHEYKLLVQSTYEDLLQREVVWLHMRHGDIYDPRNGDIEPRLKRIKEERHATQWIGLRSVNPDKMRQIGEMFCLFVGLIARMNKEVRRIVQIERGGEDKAVKEAENAKRAEVRRRVEQSDDVIMLD